MLIALFCHSSTQKLTHYVIIDIFIVRFEAVTINKVFNSCYSFIPSKETTGIKIKE